MNNEDKKYKIGDKVTIKTREELSSIKGFTEFHDESFGIDRGKDYDCTFESMMNQYCGNTYEISAFCLSGYEIKDTNEYIGWEDWMLNDCDNRKQKIIEVLNKGVRKGVVEFRYFNKDDYVRTIFGVGIVIEDEGEIKNEEDLRYSKVKIQHKSDCEDNPGNKIRSVTRDVSIRINKIEYDEDE